MSERNVHSIPDDVINAHEKIQAKQKLVKILKSKSIKKVTVSAGDMIEDFSKNDIDKTGKSSLPKTVMAVDYESRNVLVPRKSGKHSTVAFEDIRIALPEDFGEYEIRCS